nr:opticin isoform X1 [Pogona vitticeps]
MQIVALVGVITAFTLALPVLPKKDGKMKKEKHNIGLIADDNQDLNNHELNLDNYGEVIDLSNYEEIYNYGDLASKIEVGTLAPHIVSVAESVSTTTEVPITEVPQKSPTNSILATPEGPDLFPSITNEGLPTCLICVCISTSVYCDDTNLESIPPLPLETTYFYACFNRITRIGANDFSGLAKLKHIDLTSNFMSSVDEDSFRLLPSLEELVLPENKLISLPELPGTIVQLDVRFNTIQSAGIQPEAFKNLKKLQFLRLSDNKLDYIPVPLP